MHSFLTSPIALTLISLISGGLGWLATRIVQGFDTSATRGWKIASEREEEIRLLRIALHRSGRRESAVFSACEILLLAFDLPPDQQIRVIRDARTKLELAASPRSGVEQGGGGA